MMTIVSGLIGAVSGITQNVIEKKQERKAEGERYEKLIQLEDLRIRREVLQADVQSKVAETNTFDAFARAVVQVGVPLAGKYKSERIANFIIALTRPVVTLILLLMAMLMSIKYGVEHRGFILEATFATLDYTIAYWFIRRSFEKKMNIQS